MAAWANLHDVTRTLTHLLHRYIRHVVDPGFDLTVTDQLPTALNNVTRTLNLYMYHVREDPGARNLAPIGPDLPPAPYTPLGLELFYLMTSHHHVAVDVDAEMQQRLMGYAIKTFHDVPLITDATMVDGHAIMAGAIKGMRNRFEIVPRNPTPEEALSIWTTGNREFTRLASYYGVRAVFLDPLPAKTTPGIVLSIGAHAQPAGALQLGDTQATVQFTMPDGAPASAQSTPAIVFLSPAPDASPAPHPWPNANAMASVDMDASASDLRVVLRNPAWTRLTPPLDTVLFDPALNAQTDWMLSFRPPGLVLQIGAQLNYRDAGGAVKTVAMYPGSCAVKIEKTIRQTIVSGQLDTQVQASNETSFIVAPRVQTELSGKIGAMYRIVMAPGSMVAPGAGDPAFAVELSVNGQIYAPTTAASDPPAGQFKIVAGVNLPPPRDTILFTPAAGTATGVDLPARLAIGGAYAQPFWVRL